MRFNKTTALLAVAFLISCRDQQPTAAIEAPQPTPPASLPTESLQRIDCVGRVDTKVIRCGAPASAVNPYVIMGGQDQYVTLASSGITYDGSIFSFDVTVKNLIPQPLGTIDGTTPQASGVRVFFASGPTVAVGTGNATVDNPTGFETYTATHQPYFQYAGAKLGADGFLSQGEVSDTLRWRLAIDPTVTSFDFTVYVAAEVRYPQGYVDVTIPSPYVLQAGTQAVTATQRTYVGNAVTGSTLTYESLAPAVATVDANTGVITGVAPGVATIKVSSGAVNGTVSVQVCPNLAVGEVYTTVGSTGADVCFGGAGAETEYTMIPMNAAASGTQSLTVTGTGIQAVTGPPTPNKTPLSAFRVSDANGMDAINRTRRSALNVSATRMPPLDEVGDVRNYNTNSACSGSPSIRTGTVRSVSRHAIIVDDNANPAGGFTTAQFDSIALEFDTVAFAVDSQYFSPPTDLDNNQDRIILFFTRAVNELTPPGGPNVGNGYFATKDVFGTDDCSNSNGQATIGTEILYMDVPDPTGSIFTNVRTVQEVRDRTIRIAGHELQHLINAMARGYVTGASFFETGFLNEALSTAAEELMFRRITGLPVRGNTSLADITTAPNAVAYQNFMQPQELGLKAWLQRPDTMRFAGGNVNSRALRGFGAAFLRYAADRVNGGDEVFFRKLVTSNLEGLPNIQNAIGGANSYDWFRDFEIALYADDNAFAMAGAYQTPSWDFRSIYSVPSPGFPLLARPLANASPLTLSYAASTGASYLRFGVSTGTFATIASRTGGVTPQPTMRLSFVRTK